ncbi:MAG: hypothetical protein AAFR38_06440 [Planctomycetota bacterium]
MADTSTDGAGGFGPPTLDEILIALQKSLSLVSARTGAVESDQARAVITGAVEFDLETRFEAGVSPDSGPGARPNRFVHRSDGPITLRLKGEIQTDIRTEEETDAGGDADG